MNEQRIGKDHPRYNQLLSRWMRDHYPRYITFDGIQWMSVTNNDEIYFVETETPSLVDDNYESHVFGRRK